MSISPNQPSANKLEECGGQFYKITVINDGKIILNITFSQFNDVSAIIINNVIQMIKIVYPEAKIDVKICNDDPQFAFPLYTAFAKAFESAQRKMGFM